MARARARARARAAAVAELPVVPEASPRPRLARRLLWPVLASVAFVGVLFVAVFPTQTYLEHRREVDSRRARLAAIEAEAADLEERVADLQGDEAIELIAREEWGFVYPGEEAYAVVGLDDDPTTTTSTTTTTTAPPPSEVVTPATATTNTN